MEELKEIEKLKEQINNLQAVVNRLEAGETKYMSMPQQVLRQRNDLFRKYFGSDKEFAQKTGVEKGYAYRLLTAINEGVSKIADATYKHIKNFDTNKQVKTIIKTDEMLKEYLNVCDFYYCMVSSQILNKKVRK